MVVFLLLSLIVFEANCQSVSKPECISFDQMYYNRTTQGELIPKLFELYQDHGKQPDYVIRVGVWSVNVSTKNPLLVQMGKDSATLHTVLPRIQTANGYSDDYYKLQETMCELVTTNTSENKYENTVRVAVSSSAPAMFHLIVMKIYQFNLGFIPTGVTFSPAEPVFYRFSFPQDVDLVAIQLTSTDNLCARFTVKKANCPVFDTEGQTVLYDDYLQQTFTRTGYVKVHKDQFGEHLHIIVTVLPWDSPCKTKGGSPGYYGDNDTNDDREKQIILQVLKKENHLISFFVVGGVFLGILIIILIIGVVIKWLNGQDHNPRNVGNVIIAEASLAQCVIFIPLSLIVVLVKYADTEQPSNSDTCSFNFKCGVTFLGFQSANNILSSLSISFAGLVNILIRYDNWEKQIPMNMFAITTGILWAFMNVCPQKQTFHLYTFAMLSTVMEATFVLVGTRNVLPDWNRNIRGTFAMVWMFLVVLDTTLEIPYTPWYLWLALFVIGSLYIVFFLYSLNYIQRWLELWRQHRVQRIAEDEGVGLIVADPQAIMVRLNGRQMRFRHPTSNIPGVVFLCTMLIVLISMTVVLPILKPWANATLSVLSLVQLNFVVYFAYYIANKVIYERPLVDLIKKTWKFFLFTILFFASIAAWGYMCAFRIPAFVPWTAAESRNLNSECLFTESSGIDWRDVLHYTTALICVLYPAVLHFVDENIGNGGNIDDEAINNENNVLMIF